MERKRVNHLSMNTVSLEMVCLLSSGRRLDRPCVRYCDTTGCPCMQRKNHRAQSYVGLPSTNYACASLLRLSSTPVMCAFFFSCSLRPTRNLVALLLTFLFPAFLVRHVQPIASPRWSRLRPSATSSGGARQHHRLRRERRRERHYEEWGRLPLACRRQPASGQYLRWRHLRSSLHAFP